MDLDDLFGSEVKKTVRSEPQPKRVEKKKKAAKNTTTGEVHDEQIFFGMLEERGIPIPRTEYEYSYRGKYRADYAWPEMGIILEVQGGIFMGRIGRHSNPVGHIKDMKKYNNAAAEGWRLLQCTPQQLTDPEFVDLVWETYHGGWEL